MTINRIHGSGIATLWLQTLSLSLSDYASLSDDSDFSRRIFSCLRGEFSFSTWRFENSSVEIGLS